jgi:hypothetical protein
LNDRGAANVITLYFDREPRLTVNGPPGIFYRTHAAHARTPVRISSNWHAVMNEPECMTAAAWQQLLLLHGCC